MTSMLDSDWFPNILLRSDWLGTYYSLHYYYCCLVTMFKQ